MNLWPHSASVRTTSTCCCFLSVLFIKTWLDCIASSFIQGFGPINSKNGKPRNPRGTRRQEEGSNCPQLGVETYAFCRVSRDIS